MILITLTTGALQDTGDTAKLTVHTNSTALPVTETASEATQAPCPEPVALYIPHAVTSASHTALQSVTQAAQTASQVGAAAGAYSLAAIQYTSHHSAVKACAAATAVAKFSCEVTHKACSVSRSTGLALHHGISHTSASLKRQWVAAGLAVGKAGHATALAVQSFGSDVAEASRVMVREAPAVVRRMQDDVSYVLEGAQGVVKHAGCSVAHSVSHATHQVSRFISHPYPAMTLFPLSPPGMTSLCQLPLQHARHTHDLHILFLSLDNCAHVCMLGMTSIREQSVHHECKTSFTTVVAGQSHNA